MFFFRAAGSVPCWGSAARFISLTKNAPRVLLDMPQQKAELLESGVLPVGYGFEIGLCSFMFYASVLIMLCFWKDISH